MALTLDGRQQEIIGRLTRLHPKFIDLSLDRVERLLASLDHPETALPPVAHVAGTNGKGSLIAFLRAVLEAAGYRVHAYTSPHLIRFNERICLAGETIADDALVTLLGEVEKANAEEPITFFEVTTCAAFLAFSRDPADVLLLETGLGGRLDATNVIHRPVLAAITPVSIDHQSFLGDALSDIAREKTGILRRGVPAVVGAQEPAAATVIAEVADGVGAPLYRRDRDWAVHARADGFAYSGESWTLELPRPALLGEHQIDNAGHAVACLERLEGFRIAERHIVEGLRAVTWSGRLQRLDRGALADLLPADWELWLDGGHNPAAGEAVGRVARAWREADGRPLDLVFGMLSTRDPHAFLRPLAAETRRLRAVAIPGEQAALPAEEVAGAASDLGIDARPARDMREALASIVRAGDTPARVLVCGSLYLAGAALAANADTVAASPYT